MKKIEVILRFGHSGIVHLNSDQKKELVSKVCVINSLSDIALNATSNVIMMN